MNIYLKILINGILALWFWANVYLVLIIIGLNGIAFFEDKTINSHLYEKRMVYVDSFQVEKAYEGKYNDFFGGRYEGFVFSKDLNSYSTKIETNQILKNDGNVPIPEKYFIFYRKDNKTAELTDIHAKLKSRSEVFWQFITYFIPTLLSIFLNIKIVKKINPDTKWR